MLVWRERDRIDRTTEATQMTDLAIDLIGDVGLVGARIHANHVGRTSLDTVLATDATMNFFNRHSLTPGQALRCA